VRATGAGAEVDAGDAGYDDRRSIMKETTIEQVPATTRKLTITICDCCGAKTDDEWETEEDSGYQSASHEVTVESIRVNRGYEMDGKRTGLAWDFCPTCFDQKVRPLLETIAKARKVEETW
jgi:hypothetical protein